MNNLERSFVACLLAASVAADVSSLFGGGSGGAQLGRATILALDSAADDAGFRYAYRTSHGIDAEQQGRRAGAAGAGAVSGRYSYVGADGQTYSVTYTADENGYRAQGAHLPTPPPIPGAILKSLQLTAPRGQFQQFGY